VGLDVFEQVSATVRILFSWHLRCLGCGRGAHQNIRLTSAVTVLGSEDPVRVFQNFSTLDLISGGRVEIVAGRGSFAESFPLFGYDRDDYADLFREKLVALLAICADSRRVNQSASRFAACLLAGACSLPSVAADLLHISHAVQAALREAERRLRASGIRTR
jgi:alkanesulfonate monooxygenase SsuD/methylene tetrahydromethanopterin reductase-like flavin-dependent oxidoreductase (luciferase family)